jgi:RNA polymerase sigma factor (sigma-70 family)
MIASQASQVFHCIRTLALHQHDGATDGNLLDLYVRQKDKAAFEALVRRHGPMVLGVCRRILGNRHDAEDAFQATFLVLVRKAASIRPAGMVGNWLYGVAQRTALEARRSAAKRRVKEAQVAPRTETPDDTLAHLRPLLDQELERLADKYRAVLLLCDLEGRTRKEAAQQLGLPEGTIASRQARARAILAKRLTRQGGTLSSGALAAALAQEAVSAPLSLVFATVRAATTYAAGPATAAVAVSAPVAALTEGVLKAMLLSKLKITLVLFAVIGVVGAGLGGVSFRARAGDQPAVPSGPQQVAQADGKQSKAQQSKDGNAKKEDGKKTPDEKKPPDQDQTKQALDMVLKGFQAYQASKGKENERPDKQASDRNAEAFLKAFQVSSEIAKAMGKKTPAEKASPDREQVKQVLEMVLSGLQAYQASKGKEGEQRSKDVDLYAEAFLKAFQISSEIAKAKGKAQAKLTPEDQAILDSCGPAFVQAYERAKTLKKALEEQKAAGGKGSEQAMEALDVFLKAGREFEQAVKLRAKTRAVEHARKEIENALSRVEKTAHDQRMALEALEEIERTVQDMKKKVKEREGGK